MLLQLECSYAQYDWGKLGSQSLCARYAHAANPSVDVDEKKPFAELWMGTHPKMPAHVLGSDIDLREVVKAEPAVLGNEVIGKFGSGELPFLFKVLSIRKPLSIQAHPDKELGRILYARDPKNYPDDNHKPEMAIALTDFEGFCGFRPPAEIAHFLKTVPEFSELVGSDIKEQFLAEYSSNPKHALRTLFGAVMEAPQTRVSELASKLVAHAESGDFPDKDVAELLVRVNKEFPGDVGLFCGGLMLNYCRLKPGEAMFLRAKDPHAYISGDIIECMAASDNVVRAGFTPKFKDVPTLINMLTYASGGAEDQKMTTSSFPRFKGGTARLFDPPIEEFAVLETYTKSKSDLEPLNGPSIFIVTQGSGVVTGLKHTLKIFPGAVFFSAADTPLHFEAVEPVTAYHAFCEVK